MMSGPRCGFTIDTDPVGMLDLFKVLRVRNRFIGQHSKDQQRAEKGKQPNQCDLSRLLAGTERGASEQTRGGIAVESHQRECQRDQEDSGHRDKRLRTEWKQFAHGRILR